MTSPPVVDELLEGLNDWRNVQDIVRLTFKALSDVIKSQGMSISELEREIGNKVNKVEINTVLNQKVNISDVHRYIGDAPPTGNQFISEEFQDLLSDWVTRADLRELRSQVDEIRAQGNGTGFRQLDSEITQIKFSIDNQTREMQKLQHDMCTQRDIDTVYQTLDEKLGQMDLDEFMAGKANKQSVANALHRKANKVDVEQQMVEKVNKRDLEDILAILDSKADQDKLELFIRDMNNRLSLGDFERGHADNEELYSQLSVLKRDVDSKINDQYADIEKYISMIREEIDKVHNSLTVSVAQKADARELDHVTKILSNKADSDHIANLKIDFNEAVHTMQSELNPQRINTMLNDVHEAKEAISEIRAARRNDLGYIDVIQSELGEIKSKKADKIELGDLQHQLERKQGHDDISKALSGVQSDFSHKFIELREEIRTALSQCQEDIIEIGKIKANSTDIHELQGQLTERSDQERQSMRRLEDFEVHKARADSDADRLNKHIKTTTGALNDLAHEMALKAYTKDCIDLIENKASVDEVRHAISELTREVSIKVSQTEFKNAMTEQNDLTEVLIAENCVGRWIWKSGKARSGLSIPWEIQSTNTCPDNFIWEEGKSHIMTTAPGLYEVQYAFFAREIPEATCLVNGQELLSGDSSNAEKVIGRHSAGNVIGLSVSEVLSLPARARVSISYIGEDNAEGFLCLKKL